MTGEPVSSKRRIVSRTAASKRASRASAPMRPSERAVIPSISSLGRGMLPMGSVGSVMAESLERGGFGLGPDVLENPVMDAMDDLIGPDAPVRRRPQGVSIPGRPLQSSAVSSQGNQHELALLRNQEPVKVRRVDPAIRSPLLQRRGV